MRLLQLSLDPGERAALELHPLVSVVQGLDERARDRLIRTVAAIAAGHEPPCAGMAEAHGVMLPIDEANLALLEIRTDADPVVRRADLPGALDDGSEPAPEASGDPVDDLLRTFPEGVVPELDKARRHHHDTRDALEVFREAADDSARLLNEAAEERRRLSEAISAASVESGAALAAPEDDVHALESDLAALDAGIAELGALDLEPVRVLLDAIEDPEPVEMVPHPEAQALAVDILRLHGEVAALEARMEAEGRGPVATLARLDAARAEARAAEESLARSVSSEDEEQLRHAHEEVLDAERKASGLRSRSGQRKLAHALERQQEILDRVGYPTWSAYIMGASLMGVDERAQTRLEEAEAELHAAEQAWADVSNALDDDPEHHALLDELEEVEVRAISVIIAAGGEVPEERDDLERCLRELRTSPHGASEAELVATLAHSLTTLGLHVEPDEPERVLVTAHALLDEFAHVPARLEELTTERKRLEARLNDARSRAEARAWEELEAAVDRPSSDRIAELEAELVAARAAEAEMAEALEARQSLVEATTIAERAAARRARAVAVTVLDEQRSSQPEDSDGGDLWSEIDPEAIELALMARLSSLRQVSYAGSVPIVLVDTFRGLPEDVVRTLLDAVARMAESAQVLLLTDDSVVAAWAVEQGPERASLVSVVPVYA